MNNIANSPVNRTIQRPTYDRKKLQSRIAHIGFGAFHRAHQGIFTDRWLNQTDADWGICEISLFSGRELIEQLRQQDHLYSVLEKGAEGNQGIIVGAVNRALHAGLDGIEAILNTLAEPQVAIVSLTITEKGYCMLPGGVDLDLQHPLIQQDLATPQQPKSAIGVLVAALQRRRERGLAGFSVLSCDNMPDNGRVVKKAVLAFADAVDPALSQWIAHQASFPSSMVDRIVPAISATSAAEITDALGVADPCGISCEPFIQWVIEDDFVAGRPDWQRVGAELVQNVLPYEQMKLRMLNGSHSFLAYLGYLAGYQHINECIADAAYRAATRHLMLDEQAPTLAITGVDLSQYAERLIERYQNPALQHRAWQIAMDGSQKLPQRILASVRWHLAQQRRFDYLALAVAAWMRFVGAVDDQGQAIEVRDPMAAQLAAVCASTRDGVERVNGLLALTTIFAELSQQPQFIELVTRSYLVLMRIGAQATVEQLVEQGRLTA